MNQLHLIKTQNGWHTACPFIEHNESILLIEEAVYLIYESAKTFNHYPNLFVLKEDLELRGIYHLIDQQAVALVNYDGMVDLVAEHDKTITWF